MIPNFMSEERLIEQIDLALTELKSILSRDNPQLVNLVETLVWYVGKNPSKFIAEQIVKFKTEYQGELSNEDILEATKRLLRQKLNLNLIVSNGITEEDKQILYQYYLTIVSIAESIVR